jgi:hypothetical protein
MCLCCVGDIVPPLSYATEIRALQLSETRVAAQHHMNPTFWVRGAQDHVGKTSLVLGLKITWYPAPRF